MSVIGAVRAIATILVRSNRRRRTKIDVEGLVVVESDFSAAETVQRLVDRAQSEGLQVFARIDHAAGARDVGLELRPTVLVLVGHPRGGTALMQDQQTAGIDLPAKALVWEDDAGRVWLGYNDPGWISRRHGLSAETARRVVGISNGLADLAAAATSSLSASPGSPA